MSNPSKLGSQKTILILHPHFTIAGGAGNFVLEVGSRLSDLGYNIVVLTIHADSSLIDPYQSKLSFIELGGPLTSSLKHWLSFPLFVRKIIRTCDSINADVLFPQVFPSNWWGFIYKLLRPKCKLIWMCQEPSAFIHSPAWISAIRDPVMGSILKIFNPILKKVDIFLAKHVDFVFANSIYGSKYAANIYGYKDETLQPLYLGVSSSFILGKNAPVFADRNQQLITVCRLTKFKNVSLIIEAISRLKKTGMENVRLKIVGLGEEEHTLKSQVARLDLLGSVEFCGALSRQDLVLELSKSRAFVLASVNEPFGLAVVEAMACGTPAVVVESGGPSEIVQNEISGYHFKAHDIDSLTSKLIPLLLEQQVFEKLSAGATKRAGMFNWDSTTEKIELAVKNLS